MVDRSVEELLASTRYAGEVRPWRDDPRTEASDDEPNDAPQPLYVSRPVLNAKDIIAWAKQAGFVSTLPADDMHVTVCYSKTPVDWNAVTSAPPTIVTRRGRRKLTHFGEDSTVLLFDCAALQDRHDEFARIGASFDYPQYQPHITLSYHGPENLKGITPYHGPIELGAERFEPVVASWHEGVTELSQIDFAAVEGRLNALEFASKLALYHALRAKVDALVREIERASRLDVDFVHEGLAQAWAEGPALMDAVQEMLRSAWDRGRLDAMLETRRTDTFVTRGTFTPRKALRWLQQTSFWIAGVMGDAVLNEARAAITQGLKTGRPLSLTMEALYVALAAFLGTPGSTVDPAQMQTPRLETIVRTNTTTAYNHGRLTAFVDPDVLPYLKGVRYSAILDERTTPVCAFLDGKVFAVKAGTVPDDLYALLPPNHYNCRSLVVAVVAGEVLDPASIITKDEIAAARNLADQKFLSECSKAHAAAFTEDSK